MSTKLKYSPEERQLYLLNMFANVNSGYIPIGLSAKKNMDRLINCTNSIQKILENDEIKKTVGTWELVWGPFISCSKMDVSQKDHLAFAKSLAAIKAERNNLESNTNVEGEQNFKLEDELGFGSTLGFGGLMGNVGNLLNEAAPSEELGEENRRRGLYQVTDNTMYVIKCVKQPDDVKDGPDYFIGIAGTNSVSPFGWFKEDFDVATMKKWEDVLGNFGEKLPQDGGAISKASWQGLQQLWNMGQEKPVLTEADKAVGREYGKNETAKKEPLWDFIKSLDTTAKIAISGHSLGGALAPVLATVLADKMTAAKMKHTITVLATAGPTPGDQTFINHLHAKVANYKAIYNEIDVVPQAWINKDLKAAAAFYPKAYSFDPTKFPLSNNNIIVNRFMEWAGSLADNKYARKASNEIPNHAFEIKTWNEGKLEGLPEKKLIGVLNSLSSALALASKASKKSFEQICGRKVTDNEIKEFCAFLIYLGLQHVLAYTGRNGFEVQKAMSKMTKIVAPFKEKPAGNFLVGYLSLQYILTPLIKTVAKWAAQYQDVTS
ncbi:lipase family protein [Aureispira anguillae]|uniref:Lipase family protein n=1 Tax=Aureispira anguillae TaxID=2864201 RepID=A0A915YC80_9BACT|nr:lipase family protein [Aureispira anguillae]BDS10384.1 lipase family protein [Aureispira anguillae]